MAPPVSRTKFKALYAVIGDIHGRGDATTTFNLPDYRGRFLRGVDQGSGRDPDASRRSAPAPGGLIGDEVGSVQLDGVRAHDHETIQMIGDNNIDGVDSTATHSGDHHNEIRRTGSWGGNETRPIKANVNWLILAGVAKA
jgi:microcystin-dependent protein